MFVPRGDIPFLPKDLSARGQITNIADQARVSADVENLRSYVSERLKNIARRDYRIGQISGGVAFERLGEEIELFSDNIKDYRDVRDAMRRYGYSRRDLGRFKDVMKVLDRALNPVRRQHAWSIRKTKPENNTIVHYRQIQATEYVQLSNELMGEILDSIDMKRKDVEPTKDEKESIRREVRKIHDEAEADIARGSDAADGETEEFYSLDEVQRNMRRMLEGRKERTVDDSTSLYRRAKAIMTEMGANSAQLEPVNKALSILKELRGTDEIRNGDPLMRVLEEAYDSVLRYNDR